MNIKKNHLILIIIFVFLIFLIIVGYKMFSIGRPTVEPEKDIAKLALNWVNEQRGWSQEIEEDNLYNIGTKCILVAETGQEKRECIEQEVLVKARNHAPYTIWGRFQYYKKHKNEEDLQKIKEEIVSALTRGSVQFDNWSVRLLYDVWISEEATQEMKEKILNAAQYGGHIIPLTLWVEESWGEEKEGLEEEINDIVLKLLKDEDIFIDEKIDSESIKNNFRLLAQLSSEYYAIEKLAKETMPDEEISWPIIEMKKHFKSAAHSYYLNREEVDIFEYSLLGVAALDMYDINKEASYLDLAKKMYQNGKAKIDFSPSKINAEELAYFTFFSRELKKIDQQYSEYHKYLLSLIIEQGFDHEDYNLNFGYNAFYNFRNPNYYETRLNALIIGLLSEF